MEKKLRFKPFYHVEIIEPDKVFLFSEKKTALLEGVLHCKLAPFLEKGIFTEQELAEKLDEFPAAEVYYALLRLEKGEYLEAVSQTFSDAFFAYLNCLEVSHDGAIEKLQKTRVYADSQHAPLVEQLAAHLSKLGIQLSEKEKEADLTVMLVDDYLNHSIESLNRRALENKKAWMLVKPFGAELWIGPIFEPALQSPCWDCLRSRLEINRAEETLVKALKKNASSFRVNRASLSSSLDAALALASLEILKWIVSETKGCNLVGKIVSLDTVALKTEEHILFKRPQCLSCQAPLEQKWGIQPVSLASKKRMKNCDGGYHTISPEETVERFKDHVSSITGVVKGLQAVKLAHGMSSSIHLFSSSSNCALPKFFSTTFKKNFRCRCAGKGQTEMQAKASCLCEAIERYSGIYQGDEVSVKGTWRSLQHKAIHPKELLLFSDAQYRNRDLLNQQGHPFDFIPYRFSEEEEIGWTPVWSLSRKEYRYVPTAYCYYNYHMKMKEPFCLADSNGCAAGNSLEEAILQGLFELVERDSVAIWWYNCARRPAIDLDSFQDAYFFELQSEYQKMGRRLWVLDLTTDLNIPTFAACSAEDKSGKEILFGFGCHLDPKIGISRALTEMNQMLLAKESMIKEGMDAHFEKHTAKWLKEATLENQLYLKPLERAKRKEDFAFFDHEDLLENILFCKEVLEKKGLEMLILDQTRPDIGLSVVKVIVPGLRHFWARFAPGRLFDVPVQLGWIPSPIQEEKLNPIHMFI